MLDLKPEEIPSDQELRSKVMNYLEKNSKFRQANKVLFAHPSPFYWREKDIDLNRFIEEREFLRTYKNVDKNTNLYVSIPFCLKTNPSKCGYCLFPSHDFTNYGEVEKYLMSLEKESIIYADKFDNKCNLASVYFGGGTPNILKAKDYPKLIGIVKNIFSDFPEDIEMTLEGIPALFTEKKLKSIRDCGIKRISMDVQQLNDELIK